MKQALKEQHDGEINDISFQISDSLQSQFPICHHSQVASLCRIEAPADS